MSGISKLGDLTGRRFHRWTVLCKGKSIKKQGIGWFCRCDCGTEKEVPAHHLVRGYSKGCERCATHRVEKLRPYESVLRRAKRNAIVRNIGFSLSYEDFMAVKAEACHYCGKPLRWAEYRMDKNGNATNLDRMDNRLGYVCGNVVSCCPQCNTSKGSHRSYGEHRERIAAGIKPTPLKWLKRWDLSTIPTELLLAEVNRRS